MILKELKKEQEKEKQQDLAKAALLPSLIQTIIPKALTPSSPVEGDNLLQYIEWLIKRRKSKCKELIHAYEQLNAQGYDLQTIQSWKDIKFEGKWKELDILLYKTAIGL